MLLAELALSFYTKLRHFAVGVGEAVVGFHGRAALLDFDKDLNVTVSNTGISMRHRYRDRDSTALGRHCT